MPCDWHFGSRDDTFMWVGCRNGWRSTDDDEREMKTVQARAMREEGMSYSQIAEALGYKSKSTVLNMLRECEA